MARTFPASRYAAYLRGYNTQDLPSYSRFYAFNIKIDWYGVLVGAIPSREDLMRFFENFHSKVHETIEPTWYCSGDGMLAVEAVVQVEIVDDMEEPLMFTGKRYQKGDRTSYKLSQPSAVVVVAGFSMHYEFNEDLEFATLRFTFEWPPLGGQEPPSGVNRGTGILIKPIAHFGSEDVTPTP
ncbi:MAG: hypothetical protein M1834_000918 [Cirrosporium novae-zelandiae]|nr:MAG: hypothetical protein M1834_000918 [Cirrosporium novae-zelandiae]